MKQDERHGDDPGRRISSRPETESAERRRRAETSRQLQHLADALPAFISYVDADLRYALVNRSYVEQFQRPAEQIIGHHVEEVLGPENFEQVKENLVAALSGRDVEALVTLEAPGGQRRKLDAHYTPDRLPDGSIVGCFVLATDVTARQRAEQRLEREVAQREAIELSLRLSEQRFRALADSMPQLVWMANDDGVVTYYNARSEAYDGIKETRVGWEWAPVVHPDERDLTSDVWNRAVITKEPYECEHRIRMIDGSYRWHLSRAQNDGNGRWFGTATDIHEVKEAQEALRESDRLKDEFLAMLGHELRNPLATIRTAIEILRLTPERDPHTQGAHEALDRQSAHMARLVDGLLEVSRIQLGKINLRSQTLDLRALLAAVLDDLRVPISERGLTLTTEFPAEPIWVEGDEVRLAQVFGNVLANAIKFTTPPGTIHAVMRRGESHVTVSIRDSGIGMELAQLPRVFEPFRQEETDIARAAGGLGLGLALVRGLVELHHGTVEAHSEGRGKGSEIRLCLPLTDQEAATSPRQPSAETTTRRRVLIVEDNADAAEMMQMLLELQGHDVKVVDDGPKALESLRADGADIVLCDIGLPGMSGYEVARAVRADRTIPAPRMVAVTGYGQEDDIRKARDAGFDRHLVKPVDFEALRSVLSADAR